MNTNSNSYTIIYSIIIVVLAASLLALVFQALKPIQDTNVALDKEKQMLNSLDIRDLNNEGAAIKCQEIVLADEIIGEQGNVFGRGEQGRENNGFKLSSTDFKSGKSALSVCKINGQTKYVIPIYGMGLWGTISDYIAISIDKSTVFGAYFDRDSETARLGAEIKDNRAWQNQFQSKKLFAQDPHQIVLAIGEKMKDPSTQVDSITGATLTSSGVTEMLRTCLGAYMNFLRAH